MQGSGKTMEESIKELHDLHDAHVLEIRMLREKIDELALIRSEFMQLNNSVIALVQAWNTASGIVRFVKWLGGLATAVAAIYFMIRVLLGHKL